MHTRTGSLPIGFRCNCDWQRDSAAATVFAREHGFEAIDIASATVPQLQAIEQAGVRIGTMEVPRPWGELMAADAAMRHRAADAKAAMIAPWVKQGVDRFFICAFPEDDTRPRAENFAWAVDGYRRLCRALEPLGAKIVVEGYPGSWPWYPALACTPADCRALLEQVDSDALGINFDPSHLVRVGIDPLRFIDEFASRIYHVHAKDTLFDPEALYQHGNLQPATHVKAHHFGGHHWRYTLPGRGQSDWPAMLRALVDRGYDGIISIELEDEPYCGDEASQKRGLLLARDFLQMC